MLKRYYNVISSELSKAQQRIINIEKPFPRNISQLQRIANYKGRYDIICLSYVIVPLNEEEELSIQQKYIETINQYKFTNCTINPDQFYYDISYGIVNRNNVNYLPGIIKLYQHYKLSGEEQKANKYKELGMMIADKGGPYWKEKAAEIFE